MLNELRSYNFSKHNNDDGYANISETQQLNIEHKSKSKSELKKSNMTMI